MKVSPLILIVNLGRTLQNSSSLLHKREFKKVIAEFLMEAQYVNYRTPERRSKIVQFDRCFIGRVSLLLSLNHYEILISFSLLFSFHTLRTK